MDPATADPLAWAARLCADPAGTIGRFKALTGRKSVGLFPPCIPSEVVEAAGMLPVAFFAGEREDGAAHLPEAVAAVDAIALPVRGTAGPAAAEAVLEFLGDATPLFRFPIPQDAGSGSNEELLDAVEALIEWASAISGTALNDGDLQRAIRSANRRRRLWARLTARAAESPGAYSAVDVLVLARSGALLPADAHCRILEAALSAREGCGLRAARRVFLAGVPSFAAMAAVDAAGAVPCGWEVPQDAFLRGDAIDEGGDAAVCIARTIGRGVSAAEVGYLPWAGLGRLLRRAGECGAEVIVVTDANGEGSMPAGAAGVEAVGIPVLRISGRGRPDESAIRLRELLSAVPGGDQG